MATAISEYTDDPNIINVLCIGDPHFKVKNSKETDALEESLTKLLADRKPDFIVVLGDVLDRHEIIKESPLSRCTRLLKKLEDVAPTYLVVGNHDRPNNSVFLTKEHPFNAFRYWKNITVADIPIQIQVKGRLFTFVPYVFPGRFEEAIDTMYGIHKDTLDFKRLSALNQFFCAMISKFEKDHPEETKRYRKLLEIVDDSIARQTYEHTPDYSLGDWKDSTCIFAHQEFKGAKMGAIISEDGDPWSLDKPLVVSGHIHNYDHLQNNIIYTGTPIQHAFGDRADKTVSWLTFGKDKSFTEERIDLGIPKKVMLAVNYEDIEDTTLPENAEVKVIVVGNTSQIKTAGKLSKIKKWLKQGVKVAYRDISEIDLEKREPEIVMCYEDLLVKTLEELPEEESKPLLSLFRSICMETN